MTLKASWGGPREVLGHLGAVLGPLGRILWGYIAPSQFFIDFGIDLGSILKVKRVTKWRPKSTKIEVKIQHKKRRLSRLSWDRLGPVLGRFGVDFGVKNISAFISFYKCFVKIKFLKKITLGRASEAELGSIWSPKRVQHGCQIGPKIDPKWHGKTINK